MIENEKLSALGTPADREMKLIEKYTLREMRPEEIFTFTAVLCDNEIDRDRECFSVGALNELSKLFVGVGGIFDHSMSARDQFARIYRTEVITDRSKRTACGENYTYLKAWCFMLSENGLAAKINAGINREISVSCAVSSCRCSVCGKELCSCGHVKGVSYNGRDCYGILENVTDAYEWSLVAVPAQRNAGVVKGFIKNKGEENFLDSESNARKIISVFGSDSDVSLDGTEQKSVADYVSSLENGCRELEALRKGATGRIAAAVSFVTGLDACVVEKMCAPLTVSELIEMRDTLEAQTCTGGLRAADDDDDKQTDTFGCYLM